MAARLDVWADIAFSSRSGAYHRKTVTGTDKGVDASRLSRRKPRIAMVVAGLVTFVALLLAPTAAVPEGKIVINGPGFSSHLRISVSNGNVLVNGQK